MVKKIKSALVAGVALGCLAVPLSASAADIKIGFLGGFTGPIESLVPPIAEGAKLAISQVNAAGGVLGGKTLEVITADTTCADATKASDAADRLVNVEKVAAIVGALCSGATIASANSAGIPAGVAMISPAATSPKLTTLDDKDLMFRTAPSDAFQGQVLARLVMSKGIKSVAVTYVNNDYGKGFADSFSKAFAAAGGTVTANEAHEDGKADYRAEIGSLASAGGDALVLLAYGDGSGQTITRQALESGDFNMFAGGDGMVSTGFIKAMGTAIDGKFILTNPGASGGKATDMYTAAATAAKLDPKAVYGANSYDAAFILALAIEQAGSADRGAIAKAVRDVASAPGEVILPGEWAKAVAAIKAGKGVNYEGATGSIEFDAAGDVAGTYDEVKIVNGASVVVGPLK
jgi:branched-chain amino acid transport system substrate-binding protein